MKLKIGRLKPTQELHEGDIVVKHDIYTVDSIKDSYLVMRDAHSKGYRLRNLNGYTYANQAETLQGVLDSLNMDTSSFTIYPQDKYNLVLQEV